MPFEVLITKTDLKYSKLADKKILNPKYLFGLMYHKKSKIIDTSKIIWCRNVPKCYSKNSIVVLHCKVLHFFLLSHTKITVAVLGCFGFYYATDSHSLHTQRAIFTVYPNQLIKK